jgi:ribosomal protein L25 (general stress protein Ctc)
MENKYQRELDRERAARIEAERVAQEATQRKAPVVADEEEDEAEPYVDHKKLKKKFQRFEEHTTQKTKTEIEKAVQTALVQERQQNWLKSNNDFEEIMGHADKLYEVDRELAETILEMPDNFERKKLVYKNIKALGLHKPKETKPTVQQNIDNNRKNVYYQPSGQASPPYQQITGDYSQDGQKRAYAKMQELKNKMRLG